MKLAFGAVVLGAACSNGRVEVITLNGDVPQAGAIVVSHRPDGSLIETVHVDAAGRASAAVEDDSFVTAIYPDDGISTRLYTVAVAGHADELTIHGPALIVASAIVGRLDVTAPTDASADGYQIRLACAGFDTNPPNSSLFGPQTWPISIDVPAACLGNDGRIPVIVTASTNHAPIAYAAGMATLVNGVATLDVTAWTTYAANVPVHASDPTAKFDWTLWIDGLPFTDSISNGGLRWDGLSVDRTTIHATRGGALSGQSTERNVAGVPEAIAFGDADFPAAIPGALALDGAPTKVGVGHPLHFSWQSSSVAADVVALYTGYLTYAEQKTVMWSVSLPPDATEFTTPLYEGPFAMVGPRDDPDNALQRIDSPDAYGFDDVLAAGIYALDPYRSARVVAPVSSGDMRVSSLSWFSSF